MCEIEIDGKHRSIDAEVIGFDGQKSACHACTLP